MKIDHKTFVVTGAGSGMGLELSRQLIERGATVAALDLRPQGLERLADLERTRAARLSCHLVDIADRGAVMRVRDEVLARHGHVDGLINNAGIIQPFVTVENLSVEQIERVMNVNFYGTVHVTQAFLAHLRARPEAHIANISSMGGFVPVPGQAVYGASKAAVKLFSEALYAELLETGVRVSVIFPGAVNTEIAGNSGVETPHDASSAAPHKSLDAADAARVMLDGIEDDRFHILVGADAYLMDKLSRLVPERAVRVVQKQMKALLPDD